MTTTANPSTQSTSSDDQENLLKRLIKAHNEENLTLFIGAGISKCVVGSKAMLWTAATKEMQIKLNNKDENDPLRLAQLFYQQFPEEYNEFVHSMIDSSAPPSPVHTMIAQLHSKIIITTNWDCLIEQAVINSLMYYDVITCDEELLCSKSPYKIIKMHGDFARNDGRFVFKEDDYLNYSQNYPLVETFIKNVLITSNVLFLGYSYSDINLKMIMTWLKQNKKTANLPLYVMTEFKANQSQIKYLQNWGVETYVCKNISEKSKTQKLPTNDKDDKAQKIYTLLECIYYEISNFNNILSSIVYKIEPYLKLPALPFSLVTSIIEGGEINCDENENPILYIKNNRNDEYSSKLIIQLNDKNNIININKLKSFLQKAGITNIYIEYLSNSNGKTNKPPRFESLFDKTDHTIKFLDNIEDINNFLSFRDITFDRHYNIVSHNHLIKESLQNGNTCTALIELFNLHIHKRFNQFFEDNNNQQKITINEVFDNLPGSLKKIYKTFISSIKLEDITYKTKNLYENIEKEKTQIKYQSNGRILYLDTNSYISRLEHLNFIRFVFLNNLCADYYKEVKDFVYHSIILLIHIFIFHEQKIYLKRFELSSILHFLDKNQINKILNHETYSSENKPLQINLLEEDAKWLIDEVLNNLTKLYYSKDKHPLIDNNWATRIGYIFILITHTETLSANNTNKIFEYITNNSDIIIRENYNIFDPIICFFKKHHDDIIKNNTNFAQFIYSIKTTYIEFIRQNKLNHPLQKEICDNLLYLLSIFQKNIKISIDDIEFINDFISLFINLNWLYKHKLFFILHSTLSFIPPSIKKKQIIKIKNDVKIANNPPIAYYAYKANLILYGYLNPSANFFKEIRENKSINKIHNGFLNEELTSLYFTLIEMHKNISLDTNIITSKKNIFDELTETLDFINSITNLN